MSIVPVSNIAQYGIIKDQPAYELPPNAWSDGRNARFYDGSVWPALGHGLLTTPEVAAYELMNAYQPGMAAWLYGGLTTVYAYVNGVHTDITRITTPYTGTVDDHWNGRVFNGIPVITNGVDAPQAWSTPDVAHQLVDLPNWPANTTCKLMRAYKNFLVALDVTKNSTRFQRMVKWSHSSADSYPSSWDEALASVDAGEIVISEGTVPIVAAEPLGDSLAIYTENETWAMRFIGGSSIFGFYRLFPNNGALTQNSVARFGNRHLVVTQDDVIVHDGSSIDSIIDEKNRSWLFKQVTSMAGMAKGRVYAVTNQRDREIWICFNYSGGVAMDTALVWHWGKNTWSIRDLPDVMSIAVVDQPTRDVLSDAWNAASGSWSTDTDLWGDRPERSSVAQNMLLSGLSGNALYMMRNVTAYDAITYTTTLQRTGLSVKGQDMTGRLMSDPGEVKFLRAIQPRFGMGYGYNAQVRVGTQMEPSDDVTWTDWCTFRIGNDFKIDFFVSGRLMSVEFKIPGGFQWRLEGYDLDIETLGVF